MKILRTPEAPRYSRQDGIVSHLLASPRTCGARHLAATLVEIAPGGRQRIHDHEPEQLYLVLSGHGRMSVSGETADVGPGDCVFIPGGAPHGLENAGGEPLRYFSVAAPAFSDEQLAAWWPLDPEAGP